MKEPFERVVLRVRAWIASRRGWVYPKAPDLRNRKIKRLSFSVFVLLAVTLLWLRIDSLGAGYIEEPHAWRQTDTQVYIDNFTSTGIDLLYPRLDKLGGHVPLVLEFPLHEAMAASLARAFGPSLVWGRLVTLVFFIGGTIYFGAVARDLWGSLIACISTVLYMASPLGLYYSRAIQSDFVALFFANAMFFHLLKAYEKRAWRHSCAAALFGMIGFLVKPPCLFYLCLPVGVMVVFGGRLRQRYWIPVLFLPGSLLFVLWNHHAQTVNLAAPDLSCLPGYFKFVDMGWWYYGPLAARFHKGPWLEILSRVPSGMTGWIGLPLLAMGILSVRMKPTTDRLLAAWVAGVFLYVIVFFNLNVVHDYYQLPLLAPVSILMALGARNIIRRVRPHLSWPVGTALAAVLALELYTSPNAYFVKPELRIAAGQVIRRETPTKSILIAASDGGTKWTDPRLLYQSGRVGYAVHVSALTPAVIEALSEKGATHLVVFSQQPPSPAVAEWIGRRNATYWHFGPKVLCLVPLSGARENPG